MPNYWSFQPVVMPRATADGTAKTDLAVSLSADGAGFFGRLDHRLYERVDGEFKEVAKANSRGSSRGAKTFANVELSPAAGDEKVVYLAVETYGIVPESEGLAGATKAIMADVAFLQLTVDSSLLKVTHEKVAENLFSVTVKMMGELSSRTGANASKVRASGELKVATDINGVSVAIPLWIEE